MTFGNLFLCLGFILLIYLPRFDHRFLLAIVALFVIANGNSIAAATVWAGFPILV